MGIIQDLTWPNTLQDFQFWCQRVLPAVYDSSLSYYELLCKVVDYLNKTMQNVNVLNDNSQKMQQEITELNALFQQFKDSGFDDYYAKRMEQWIRDNAERIIKSMLGIGVFFGLTSDGYFCAYVPQTWSDIQFDTGAVYGRSDYGRLILRYQVDAPNAIDNTYRYQLPGDIETTDSIISDLELIGRTLWTHMDSPVEGGR